MQVHDSFDLEPYGHCIARVDMWYDKDCLRGLVFIDAWNNQIKAIGSSQAPHVRSITLDNAETIVGVRCAMLSPENKFVLSNF